jgi:hypothetical protein
MTLVSLNSNTTCVSSGVGTVDPSGESEFTMTNHLVCTKLYTYVFIDILRYHIANNKELNGLVLIMVFDATFNIISVIN